MFESDREFIGRIEAALPPDSQIFQLPPIRSRSSAFTSICRITVSSGLFSFHTAALEFGALRGARRAVAEHLAPLPPPRLSESSAGSRFRGDLLSIAGTSGARPGVWERAFSRELGLLAVSRDGQAQLLRIRPRE